MESVLAAASVDPTPIGFVYGESPAIAALNRVVTDIAQTDIPVLIVGESGTGKEAYARLIHRLSAVPGAYPRQVDCRAVDSNRLIAELHEVFQNIRTTDSGSVFLDGIDELGSTAQRVLLSLWSQGEWKHKQNNARPRLISSATKSLEPEVQAGRFRRELYYRLNGACLHLPPLRERKEDIAPLAEYFLEKHSRDLRKPVPELDDAFLECLREHNWPGNIRELEHFTRKLVAVANLQSTLSELREACLQPQPLVGKTQASSLKTAAKAASRERERELILEALQRTKWNRKRAAEELQISYKSMLYKIKQIEAASAVPQEERKK